MRTRRALSAIQMTVIAVVVSASCLAGQQTPEQRACCAAMGHDCGGAAIEATCCTGEAAKRDAVPPSALETLGKVPPQILVAILEMPKPHGALGIVRVRGTEESVSPPGLPTYLLVSTLRI